MTNRFLLAALATVAGFSAATGASAANFGSAVIATYRSCAAVGPTVACDGNGPGQQILWPLHSPFAPSASSTGPSVLSGGDMLSATGSFVVVDGSNSANASFMTPNSQPVFTGSTNSIGDVRLGSDGVAFYEYTNTSAIGVALTLSASIGYTSSSASPPSTGTANGQDLPGGAEYNAFVEIADPSYLDGQLFGPSSAASESGLSLSASDAFNYNMIFGLLAGADPATACGVSGIDAIGGSQGATTGGAGGTSVSSSACGGGGAYVVAPGQTVVILDGYQLISNRGGEIDPFTLTLTAAPTPNPLSTTFAIPEPSAWLFMLAGAGLVGGTLRRRARLEKLTT
jgi:hypothetical protein